MANAASAAENSLKTQVCLGSTPGCCQFIVDQNGNVCGEP